jgi:hypothetical protein
LELKRRRGLAADPFRSPFRLFGPIRNCTALHCTVPLQCTALQCTELNCSALCHSNSELSVQLRRLRCWTEFGQVQDCRSGRSLRCTEIYRNLLHCEHKGISPFPRPPISQLGAGRPGTRISGLSREIAAGFPRRFLALIKRNETGFFSGEARGEKGRE